MRLPTGRKLTMSTKANNFMVQSAAAEDWLRDETDRLHRHGAKQLDVDYFDMTAMTPEQMDAYIKEKLESKSEP